MNFRHDIEVSGECSYLANKRVILSVTGGIAAVETVKIIRELRRWGASVNVIMSPAAVNFVTPLSLEWASGNRVITELSGEAEHIASPDVILVAPATLNTIQKMIHGIADNPLLLQLASAWGAGVPIVMAPAMHESLWNNPPFKETLNRLNGDPQFKIVSPIFFEGKAKLATVESICLAVSTVVNTELKGKRFLVTGGPTEADIDAVRVISNRSTGELSCLIVRELLARGADVEFLYGNGHAVPPTGASIHRIKTPDDMRRAIGKIMAEKRIDAGVFAAAVLDFVPEVYSGKIDSSRPYHLTLNPIEKIIDTVRGIVKIGFKLETNLTTADLVPMGERLLSERNWDACLLNSVSDINSTTHKGLFVSRNNPPVVCSSKREIASAISGFLIDSSSR